MAPRFNRTTRPAHGRIHLAPTTAQRFVAIIAAATMFAAAKNGAS
jgi:hypothetical protein